MVTLALPLLLVLPAQDGREVVELVCLDCHAGATAEASFDLEGLLARDPIASGLFDWRRARALVEVDAMPPGGDLSEDERLDLMGFFEEVESQALEHGGAAGFEPIRRLTRTELRHALRDLLGVELDVEEWLPPELVPENGFAASADTLWVHTEWLDRVRTVTRIAVARALPDEGNCTPHLAPETFDLPRFLRRAYRRPATTAERKHYEGRFEERGQGRAVLEEILASPHFLMRLEDAVTEGEQGVSQVGHGRPVSDHGLASRLSFLVWCAPPDDELLDLADADRLHHEAVLQQQLARLLADPRALAFGESFAGQWLGTSALGHRVRPDPIDNAEMTDTLLAAMREEVARFVLALFVEERPLADLLQADFTFMNGELARFYRARGVQGSEMQRVTLVDSRRKGLLGKAGLLAVTAYPDRTSPVLRGAFLLDDLLDTPPPPPPPGASEFDEELFEQADVHGPRSVLELHRSTASCAACHARIDPLGFALEGFDRLGRTRSEYLDGTPIDTSGRLPDGTPFQGPTALSRVLLEGHRSELARSIARRLLRYGLGRRLTWEDERTVYELAATLDQEGFGGVLRGLLASRPFLHIGPPEEQ